MKQLAIFSGDKTIANPKGHYIWPRITPELKQAVLDQLEQSVSIYDRSGIFAEFETTFANYHGRHFALLSNSGTNAIYSMFEGINLQQDDEVLCPTYTFYASVTPLLQAGATPIFCDSLPDGNIDPGEIKRKITTRTKAVIITHMWGIPCDMDAITQICQENNLALLEDCSHAHGATYKGRKVGTFGIASAFSLQGQKPVTGGEGGIMTTDDEEVYYRALLQGHYNKRCRQEIPPTHPLAAFALTGFGLKFRAHPLAIAIANEQFSHLDEWIIQKQRCADQMMQQLDDYPFLHMPVYTDKQPSWYALVMQFDPSQSNGVTIDQFVKALFAEGLMEVDRPNSTCPLHNLPLFRRTHEVMRLYTEASTNPGTFPLAEAFYKNAIKLPVWAFPDEQGLVDLYIEGIHKVSQAVILQPEVFSTI